MQDKLAILIKAGLDQLGDRQLDPLIDGSKQGDGWATRDTYTSTGAFQFSKMMNTNEKLDMSADTGYGKGKCWSWNPTGRNTKALEVCLGTTCNYSTETYKCGEDDCMAGCISIRGPAWEKCSYVVVISMA